MTGQDGSHSNSGGAVSAAEFQAMQTQITQLMQQLQALQHDLHHAPNMEDQPDNEEHDEDNDPAALEAEAARRAAAEGGGRGRGAGRGHGAGFGNFGAPNTRPQFFGRAQRVPVGGAAGFDGDTNFGYRDDHRTGYHGHHGGYDDRGGGGHFGAFGDHQFAGDDGHRDRRRGDPERRRGEDGLGKVKVSIPTFNSKENADSYYEWETKVEQIFDLYDYPAEKKAKLAALEFKGYAITWWNQIRAEYHRVGHDRITWEDMKREMRRRFVPVYYSRDLHLRLTYIIPVYYSRDLHLFLCIILVTYSCVSFSAQNSSTPWCNPQQQGSRPHTPSHAASTPSRATPRSVSAGKQSDGKGKALSSNQSNSSTATAQKKTSKTECFKCGGHEAS
jgi:hypothetical protein